MYFIKSGSEMPTYDYECQNCGHLFEYFQSINDEALKECPVCGKEVKRLIAGGLGVIFKGSGFYVNDSKKKTQPSSEKPAAAKSES